MTNQNQAILTPFNLQRELDQSIPIGQKLELVHNAIRRHSSEISRVAVALYDAQTDRISTFIHSSGMASPLHNYSVKMSEVDSLCEIAHCGMPRIHNDLTLLSAGSGTHTQKLLEDGYRSSLTYPLYHNGRAHGFVFFNSHNKNIFSSGLLDILNIFSQVISSLIIMETVFIRTVTAATRTALNISRHKDEETGEHLERMAHYSRLIAASLASSHGLDDEFIEYMHLFAPMHDIGKVAIPDVILLKPGRLSEDEFAVMRSHTTTGRELIDNMATEFAIDGFPHIQMLRNIVELHHETMDGSGYPRGLKKIDIPMEARICAVADVFDALTSQRPYKAAWDNGKAFSALNDLSGSKLDRDCVEALLGNFTKVKEIQTMFSESPVDFDHSGNTF